MGKAVNNTRGTTLGGAVRYWPTPSANEDAAGTPAGNMQRMLGNCEELRGKTPEEWDRGVLNPDWVEWLMGWPIGWSNIKRLKDDTILNWTTDPADIDVIPRLTKISKNRKHRLMALGNGQVPACVVKAFNILTKGV